MWNLEGLVNALGVHGASEADERLESTQTTGLLVEQESRTRHNAQLTADGEGVPFQIQFQSSYIFMKP